MKDFIHLLLAITGFLSAGFMSMYSFLLILKFISETNFDVESVSQLCIGFLGIIGFIGMFLLFLEHRVSKWAIIICLSAGVISSFWFISISGKNAWEWVFTIKEPSEWILFMWPTLVAIYSIFRLTFTRSL